jgi:hypothetical protein
VSPEEWAALGALLSGVGSIMTAWIFVRSSRKRAADDCEKRMQAFRDGLHEQER